MGHDFRSYHKAIEDLLARDMWARLGEKGRVKELVEEIRKSRIDLSDHGALPALIFVQVIARVTDSESLTAYLRENDRLAEPADGKPQDDAGGLVFDALLAPIQYAPTDEEVVWTGTISRHGETEEGDLVVEAPLQIDALELCRGRAIRELERLVATTVAEFAEETPGIELVDVEAERIG
jgi:hypothetical protein